MKSIYRLILGAVCLAAAPAMLAQQHTYSGYFLDGYTYRYQMNPAMDNEDNFVAMPALGNLNIGFQGNLHLKDVLYNVDGRTSLFTNPNISSSEVMKHIHDKNRIGTHNQINILSGGWKAWGGYNTVTISAIANADAAVPGAFFELAKEGVQNKTYEIKHMSARAAAYGQIALNHSRDIKQVPGLRVGAALKFLIGVGGIDFQLDEADLTLGQDAWIARTRGNIYASIGGFRFDHKTYDPKGNSGMLPYEYVSGGNIDNFSINGFGMALDLGATYKWNDFKFSAALLDMGFIAWGKTQWASTEGTQTINTDAYTFNVDGDASNSFSNELDNMKDNLSKLYQLRDMGEQGSHTNGLAATMNFGVDYEFPLYRKLHFGVLSSTRIYGRYSSSHVRFSANVAPVKCFSADINLGAGTFGADFGWMLNFHTKGFNLFLGMDRTLGKLAKQGVPLSSNASVNFGMNFPF